MPYARQSTLAKVCKDEHFYTVDDSAKVYNLGGVTDKYLVEKSFHAYENSFQALIAKVSSGSPLLHSEAASLLRIVVDLKFRNKFFRDRFIGPRQGEVVNEAFTEMAETFDNEAVFREKYAGATPEEMASVNQTVRDFLLNDSNFKKNAHLSSLVNRGDGYEALMDMLVPKLLNCQWVVLKSAQQFISNDNPGCSMDKATQIHNTYFDRDFMFIMPLTSSICLTISDAQIDMAFYNDNRYKGYAFVNAPREMIEVSNSFAVRNFNKIAFGPDKASLDDLAKQLKIVS